MSQFEDIDPDDDFEFDEELREIEAQLFADADHLNELYPAMNTSRLDDLISQCTSIAENNAEQQTAEKELVVVQEKPKRVIFQRWFQVTSAACLCIVLVAAMAFMLNQPVDENSSEPIVANDPKNELQEEPSIAIQTVPPEILNASEPELEAIYDLTPKDHFTVSVEF